MTQTLKDIITGIERRRAICREYIESIPVVAGLIEDVDVDVDVDAEFVDPEIGG
ncbi:hypothetical protein KAU11_09540 [Candidatus Babeliales bacterium]|nr:hypothetical protein [Candidatus Babeliales bacterium]